MKNINSNERGSILPMFAVVVVLFFIVAAVAVDFARYALVAEKLQTAADSAAAAAAKTSKRYVRLSLDRGERQSVCCDDFGCSPCCIGCETIEIEGREDDLIESAGYTRYCCSCGCGPVEILERWVEYEDNGAEAAATAELFFEMNKPKEMDTPAGGESEISSISVRGNTGDPLYPSVIVRAQGKMKTLMMGFMDRMYPGGETLFELGATRCAQGGSFYYDLNGKWHRAAAEGCEE